MTLSSWNFSQIQNYSNHLVTQHQSFKLMESKANTQLTDAEIDTICRKIPLRLSKDMPPSGLTPTDIVMWLLRTLGAFITTLLLSLLHHWFPQWFPSTQPRKYIQRPNNSPNIKP